MLTIACNNPGCGNTFKDADILKGDCQRCGQIIINVNMDIHATRALINLLNKAQMGKENL